MGMDVGITRAVGVGGGRGRASILVFFLIVIFMYVCTAYFLHSEYSVLYTDSIPREPDVCQDNSSKLPALFIQSCNSNR